MSGVEYLDHGLVRAAYADDNPPRNPYAMEYGPKIPTRYRLMLADGRMRRVYCAQFSNAGSLWVRVAGRRVFLCAESEYLLEQARDGGGTRFASV